jgi:hypothetical protein
MNSGELCFIVRIIGDTMKLAVLRRADSTVARRLGLRWARRFVLILSTMKAIENEAELCWKYRFRSVGTNTSKCFDAWVSNSPFLIAVQPICRAILTS